MGLAASQARLLTITARKADCEFLSMSLSHQKLALSRNMEKISSEYQESLNKTKLVYDYYGSGDSDMDLTYGLLMSPSIYNDYYPKMVTDSKNRMVLNSAYAEAARAAGIPAEGFLGTASSTVRNKFISALADIGAISTTQAATIQGITFNNTMGFGNSITASQSYTDVSYKQLIELFDIYAISTNEDLHATQTYNQYQCPKFELGAGVNEGGKPFRYTTYENGEKTAEYTYHVPYKGVTISDLLDPNQQHVISCESGEGKKDGHTPILSAFNLLIDSNRNDSSPEDHGQQVALMLDWLKNQFTTVLGGIPANDTAIEYAYNTVFDIIYPSDSLVDAVNTDNYSETPLKEFGTNVSSDNVNQNGYQGSVANAAQDYLGLVYSTNRGHSGIAGWFHSVKNDNTTVAISLSNIAQAFMTSFVTYMQGMNTDKYSYEKGAVSSNKMYDPKRDDFQFTIVGDTEIEDDGSDLYANFYDTMFNLICVNGWTENDQVNDKEYMAEMLKSGMMFISTMSDDCYYYQGNYATERNILEVADEEAISKAEAKYNTEKTKIENKEQTIDLKMKNLDTEISSLTTEYDTTKSLVTKAIEKSIKRYEA